MSSQRDPFTSSTSGAASTPMSAVETAAHRALARRIYELRQAKGWSQNHLADFSGIARSYLSHILAGDFSPTLRILARIAEALEVEVKDLFG